MGRPTAKSKLVKTLRRLQRERDPVQRAHLIELGRKALLNWFAMGAKNLLRGVLPVNKLTGRFIQAHRHDLNVIANKNANEEDRKKAILKRGGAGFLGGTIIRHLFKWETGQKRKRRPRSVARVVKQKKTRVLPPSLLALAKKRKKKVPKVPKKVPKLIIHRKTHDPKTSVLAPYLLRMAKFPKKKKTPKLIVKIPFSKYMTPQNTPPRKTKTLAELKQGLAEKKMERAMRGPIGTSRTTDTALPSFGQAFGGMAHFTPLSTSTPKQKYKCRYCPLQYNLKSSRDRHEETVHHGRFNPQHPSA